MVKYAQRLYAENCKALMGEIREGLNDRHPVFIDWATQHRKDDDASRIVCGFSAIPFKIPAGLSLYLQAR